ncbi:MAG: hypothetical protein JNN15_17290 [Blastocatellia bacterium]|nr:hypothetical protein [Blastocatellia bacterium]
MSERREQEKKGLDLIFSSQQQNQKEEPKTRVKQEVAKVTLYIRPDQVLAIEKIQLAERERTGSRRDKSLLIQEAIDLLVEKYGNEQ